MARYFFLRMFGLSCYAGLYAADGLYLQVQNSQLVRAPASLLRRRKQQFVHVDDHNVRMILGLNGYIIVSPQSQDQPGPTLAALHHDVARAAAAVRVLVAGQASVEVAAVRSMLSVADEMQIDTAHMLDCALVHALQAGFCGGKYEGRVV